MKRIVVTGAAGFIGRHLVNYLKGKGHWVRGVDYNNCEYSLEADEFEILDLRIVQNAMKALRPVNGQAIDEVYALSADMGGIEFIQAPENQKIILRNNLLINLNTLEAAENQGVKKYLYTSSACVYPDYKQTETEVTPLKEEDAYPAEPQDTYGWEKLITEILTSTYSESMDVRIVRFHNIYGPEGTWTGGREKAPAAICRKVAEAKLSGKNFIEIWGDGEQTRSFCYLDDCLKGLDLVMGGENKEPINLGRDELVSINELAKIVIKIAGVDLEIKHVEGPQGVRGRNSDNTKFKKLYGWAPEISLEEGMKKTYEWIEGQVREKSNNK